MRKKFLWTTGSILVLLGAGLLFSACGGMSVDAAATVNGKEISKDDVARRINLLFNALTSETPINSEDPYYKQQMPIVAEKLVTEEIDRREAEARGISVSDDEIAAGEEQVLEDNYLSSTQKMQQEFADVGATAADLRAKISGDLLHQKILDALGAEVTVSEDEARAQYNAKLTSYVYPEKRQVRQIVVADEATAQSVADRIAAGENMTLLAQQVSIDTKTAPIGGRLDLTLREQLPKAVGDMAFSLPLLQVSQPFQSDLGWYVIRVDVINAASNLSFDQVKAQLMDTLVKQKQTQRISAYEEEINNKYDTKYAEGYAPTK